MEDGAVKMARVDVGQKVFDGDRCLVFEQFDSDVPMGRGKRDHG